MSSSVRAMVCGVFLPLMAALAGAAVVSGQGAGAAPPQTSGTALIVGTVVDGDSGAVVSGAVVTLGSGLLAGGARARGAGPGAGTESQPRVMTAADGRFAFRSLPKGSFSLAVTKPGYVAGSYGRRSVSSTGSQTIDLVDGQRVTDAKIQIWRSASITGTVVDEAGEPIIGLVVRAFPRTVVSGRVRILQNAADGSLTGVTDDRGIYRHSRLIPGDYVVVVPSSTQTFPVSAQDALANADRAGTVQNMFRELNASSAPFPADPGIRFGDVVLALGGPRGPGLLPNDNVDRLRVYPNTYYGGSQSAARATIVTVKSGESRLGVDFQINPVSAVAVSGSVVGPSGPQANFGLRLTPIHSEEFTREPPAMNSTSITDALGRFQFLAVAAGTYVLRGEYVPPRPQGQGPDTPFPDASTLWAAVPLTVGEEPIRDLAVTLRTGVRIKGRIEWDGTARPPVPARISQIRVSVELANGSLGGPGGGAAQQLLNAQIDQSGQINTFEIIPGRYLVTIANLPAGWTLKSAVIGGKDASAVPFDLTGNVEDLVVTLTDRPSEVTGTVRTAQGTADPTATVVIFPTDTKAWMETGSGTRVIREARVSRDGTYRVVGLPPGEYCIAAIPDELATDWSEVKSLANLARLARRLQITDGVKSTCELQIVRIK